MARDAIVLGAGMVGVSTALLLQDRGVDAALVDRKAPGRETSFGNAGVIQAEAVEPYAFPREAASLARVALGLGGDVAYHLAALPGQAGPLLRYWRASAPARHRAASETYGPLVRRATADHAPLIEAAGAGGAEVRRQAGPLLRYWRASAPARHRAASETYGPLVRRATADHAPLIEAAGAGNLIRKDGLYQLHRDPRRLEAALAQARRVAETQGVRSRALSGEQMRRVEPALAEPPAGAIHWSESWTCADPGGLVAAYADLFARRGGAVLRGDAATLREAGAGWAVDAAGGRVEAARAVVALGPWTPPLLRRFGYRPAMVSKRGYHQHFGGQVVRATLVLADEGFVLAPMRAGLRLTTGAEIARLDAAPTPRQLRRARAVAARLLGAAPTPVGEPWMGTRPCMADLLPVVGRAPRHRGLWLHFGHGHQGFTLGPTTAALLADAIAGQPDAIPAPLRPEGRL